MMNIKRYIDRFLIRLFNFVYDFQNKTHQKRMEKLRYNTTKAKKILSVGIDSTQKCHYTTGATLSIGDEKKKEEIKQIEEKIEKLVEKYINNPKKFFDYIKGAKTPVFVTKNAKKILSIKEDEGLIYPKKGFKALYLNLILNKKISFKTKEMFVISNFNINTYAFLYQFYNWYLYKTNKDDFDDVTQEMFKNVFEICETEKIVKLSFGECLKLKSAIRNDIGAINFVQKMCKKFAMQKKALDKIRQKQSVKV